MSTAPPADLAQLQQAFKRHLQHQDTAITDYIVGDDPLGTTTRLAIYSNAYYARLEEALAQDYEAVHTLLGDEAFSELCTRYSQRHPSEFPSLRWFGQYMPEFVGTQEPYASYPYLAELATFEWTLLMAFDAEEAPVAGNDDIATVPAELWPQVRLHLQPSVYCIPYRWNILPWWRAAKDGGEFPELCELPVQEHCIIWRHDRVTRFRTFSREELTCLEGVRANENFAQLCARLADIGLPLDQVPMQMADILKTWLYQGMITRIEVINDAPEAV